MTHDYTPDTQSGAGNCTCGAPERHIRHPHAFVRAAGQTPNGSRTRCTCSREFGDRIHQAKD